MTIQYQVKINDETTKLSPEAQSFLCRQVLGKPVSKSARSLYREALSPRQVYNAIVDAQDGEVETITLESPTYSLTVDAEGMEAILNVKEAIYSNAVFLGVSRKDAEEVAVDPIASLFN